MHTGCDAVEKPFAARSDFFDTRTHVLFTERTQDKRDANTFAFVDIHILIVGCYCPHKSTIFSHMIHDADAPVTLLRRVFYGFSILDENTYFLSHLLI